MHNNQDLKPRRKELRSNATPQEIILWQYLKNSQLGYKFRRQHSIDYYIVDFCCPAKKIIIEVDGHQHIENKEYDSERTRYLEALGYFVLRFWNSEVNTNIINVMDMIKKSTETTPSRRLDTPPFQGGDKTQKT